MTPWVFLIAGLAAGGFAGWTLSRRRQPAPAPPPAVDETTPGAPPELGWVLRANRALGIWFRRAARGGVVEVVSPALSQEARHLIAARLPGLMGEGEGRSGVERLEEGNLAFVAADDIQVGVLMPPRVPTTTAIRDLEGVIAAIRTKDFLEVISSRTPSAGESVASIAVRLALEAERLLEAEVAVAIRRPRGAQVVGTALRADPHLHRVTAAPGSPVDLCVRGEVDAPMMVFEPLGLLPWDRRHRERKAFVMPIKARTGPVGALVVWTVHGAEPTGPNRAELKRAVHRSALLFEDALHRLQLVEEATRDPLTGLVNRRGLEAAMGTMDVERGALVCIDLDHFKTLNDTLGHPAGDAALGFVSRVILDTVRDRDTAARIGGEEFAVWLPGTPLDEATRVAERLRTRIAGRAWGWQGRPWPITASFGVAGWPEGTNSRENLFQLADQALYRAKQAGRNRVEVWGEERKGVGLGT